MGERMLHKPRQVGSTEISAIIPSLSLSGAWCRWGSSGGDRLGN